MENTKKQSLIGVGVLIAVVVVLAVVGLIVLRPEPEVLMGEAEASEYRVSGKVPGRILDALFIRRLYKQCPVVDLLSFHILPA
jgi:hypothetical protein